MMLMLTTSARWLKTVSRRKDRNDYEWARGMLEVHQLARRCEVLMSPSFGMLAPSDLAGWMVADRLPARLNLQLHKFVWPPEARGV